MGWTVLIAAALPLLVATTAPAAPHVERRADGAVRLQANNATLGEVLEAMADEVGFVALIDDGAAGHRLANLTVSTPSVEDALRDLLRDYNYALIYEGEDDALQRVIVLAPASKGAVRSAPPAPPRRPAKKGAKGARPAGPVVIRR